MNDDSSARVAVRLRQLAAAAAPGSALPASRSLVRELGVSPVTVQRAMARLAAEGVIETRPGVGSFVAARWEAARSDVSWQTTALGPWRTRANSVGTTLRVAPNDAMGLNSSYPAEELLPVRLVRAALGRAARSDAAIARPPSAGLPELQAWFARELASHARQGASAPSAADVIVTPGSQSALCSIFRALAAPGQPIVMESPTYWGAISAAEQAGLVIVPVSRGGHAPRAEDLDQALGRSGARICYTQPTFANPTGALWSARERRDLLEVARRHDAFVVEDDWARDFAMSPPPGPIAADDHEGRVIYLRSLTKSLSPALRIAAVIARGPARGRILADRTVDSLYVSGLLQAATLDVVTQPGWAAHLRGVSRALRERRDLLVTALQTRAPSVEITSIPGGGLNLWLRLPEGSDPVAVVAACAARGLYIAPGDEWFPAEPTDPFVRVNYAGPDPQRFDEAAQVLADAVATGSPFA